MFPPPAWAEHHNPAATKIANIAEQYHVIFNKSLAYETTFLKDLSRYQSLNNLTSGKENIPLTYRLLIYKTQYKEYRLRRMLVFARSWANGT